MVRVLIERRIRKGKGADRSHGDWARRATSAARQGVLERLAPLVDSEPITLSEHAERRIPWPTA